MIGVANPTVDRGGRVDADLDTLLIALYVELEDRIIPAQRPGVRRGPGRPPVVTDAELVCLPELAAATRRGDHLDAETPTRAGTPRRAGPLGLWTRIAQRLLALNAAIWHKW